MFALAIARLGNFSKALSCGFSTWPTTTTTAATKTRPFPGVQGPSSYRRSAESQAASLKKHTCLQHGRPPPPLRAKQQRVSVDAGGGTLPQGFLKTTRS